MSLKDHIFDLRNVIINAKRKAKNKDSSS